MHSKKLTAVLVIAAATAFVGMGGPARAQEGTQNEFMLLFKMPTMDKNKDSMVSKKEFMARMDEAYDMKAKAMGAKAGMMNEAQMKEFLRSLYGGG